MTNKMQGLLGDPLFQMGAGILANNTGHYGAFGPAVGQGMLSGMQQNRQMQALQLRQQEAVMKKKLYELKLKEANKPTAYTLSPGSRRYEGGKQVSYNPSRGVDPKQTQMEQLIKLRDRFPIGSPDYKSVQNQITKLGTVVGRTEFDRGGLTPSQYGERVQREESKQDAVAIADDILTLLDSPEIGTTLGAPQRKVAAGLIGGIGESLGMPALQDAAEWASPKKLEELGTKGTLLVGMLKEPVMKERRMSDQDRRVLENALMVLNGTASKTQIRTALNAVKEVMGRSHPRKEGEEWIGNDGSKKKLINGEVMKWSD